MIHPDQSTTNLFKKQFRDTEIPSLGFGTWQLKEDDCIQSVEAALEIGYRLIDTAKMYRNEGEVGEAIKTAGLPREELWLTSKAQFNDISPASIRSALSASLELLQTDYLDLYLIHWPYPEQDYRAAIDTLSELRAEGRFRYFGVSNFTPRLLQEALSYGDVCCDQVEYHPFLSQNKLLQIARENNMLLTAYSPLAQGKALNDETLRAIGRKHGKSSAQVALRWLIEQENVVTIPRSKTPKNIQSNFDIFDFSLDEDDKCAIAALPKDHRTSNPPWAPDWND